MHTLLDTWFNLTEFKLYNMKMLQLTDTQMPL